MLQRVQAVDHVRPVAGIFATHFAEWLLSDVNFLVGKQVRKSHEGDLSLTGVSVLGITRGCPRSSTSQSMHL